MLRDVQGRQNLALRVKLPEQAMVHTVSPGRQPPGARILRWDCIKVGGGHTIGSV